MGADLIGYIFTCPRVPDVSPGSKVARYSAAVARHSAAYLARVAADPGAELEACLEFAAAMDADADAAPVTFHALLSAAAHNNPDYRDLEEHALYNFVTDDACDPDIRGEWLTLLAEFAPEWASGDILKVATRWAEGFFGARDVVYTECPYFKDRRLVFAGETSWSDDPSGYGYELATELLRVCAWGAVGIDAPLSELVMHNPPKGGIV